MVESRQASHAWANHVSKTLKLVVIALHVAVAPKTSIVLVTATTTIYFSIPKQIHGITYVSMTLLFSLTAACITNIKQNLPHGNILRVTTFRIIRVN